MFDRYSRRARLAPVFLVALPATMLCATFVPNLAGWHRLWPIVSAGGIFVLLDQLGRDAGRRLEPTLWRSWNGPPTTRALRHREANPVLLARRHQQLATLTGISIPSREDEQRDPTGADNAYEAVTVYLRNHTRDTSTFPLVFIENCHYGFRRNMLGLRPAGLTTSILSAIGAATGLALARFHHATLPITGLVGAAALAVLAGVLWYQIVTPDWVRPPADAYAERLLEAAEHLAPGNNDRRDQ